MASTFGITAPIPTFDSISPRQAHRSRFTIEFKTPRVRRRLLVQLVTLPVSEELDSLDDGSSGSARIEPEARPTGIAQLLESYGFEQALRRWG
jgi:hypothetical protein